MELSDDDVPAIRAPANPKLAPAKREITDDAVARPSKKVKMTAERPEELETTIL